MIKSMIEEWRDIEGYEGLYQVSNLGRVKSLDRYVRQRYAFVFVQGRVLTPMIDKDGYLRVNLYKDTKMKTHTIHRLVAQAFLPNPDNLPQVNHKDEDKTNNFISLTNPDDSNLEWCTNEYNVNYGTHNERMAKALTNHQAFSKPVLCIETGIIYPSVREVERQFGICQSSVSRCCNMKRNIAGGYHWKYIS